MECKRRRCQYSTAQVTRISAVSVWPLLSPGPPENPTEYWRQENSLPFPAPIWRGLFQRVFNSYTSKLYFKLIWQLHVIPRAERLSLSQEGELHNQRCAGEAMQGEHQRCLLQLATGRQQWPETGESVLEKRSSLGKADLQVPPGSPGVAARRSPLPLQPSSMFPLHTP